MSVLVVCSVVCLYLERRQVLLAGLVSSSATLYPKSSSERLLESLGDSAVQTKYIMFFHAPVCPAAAAVDDDGDDGDGWCCQLVVDDVASAVLSPDGT